MLRFVFALLMTVGVLVGSVLLIMSIRRVRFVVGGLLGLYAICTFTDNPFKSLVILGVLYIIIGVVKDISRWFHNSDIFYDPPNKVQDDKQYIKATIVDSEEYYSKHKSNSRDVIKY